MAANFLNGTEPFEQMINTHSTEGPVLKFDCIPLAWLLKVNKGMLMTLRLYAPGPGSWRVKTDWSW